MSALGTTRVLLVPSSAIDSKNRLARDTRLRCWGALLAWLTGDYDFIVVTGGICLTPDVQTIPAAVLMAHWLIEHGLPKDRILIEPTAVDTYENVGQTIWLCRQHGLTRIQFTIVSEPLHAARCGLNLLFRGRILPRIRPLRYPTPLQEKVMGVITFLYALIDWWGVLPPALLNRRLRRNRGQQHDS